MTTFILLCYFIFCLLLTHLILFHIFFAFFAVTPEGKNRFSPSQFLILRPRQTFLHLQEMKLICEAKFAMRRKLNQRSIKITFTEKLISANCERERFIWSQNIFPQIMQFSTTINHFKPGEWSERNSSLCPPGWLRNWMWVVGTWIIKSTEILTLSIFFRSWTFNFSFRCMMQICRKHVASSCLPTLKHFQSVLRRKDRRMSVECCRSCSPRFIWIELDSVTSGLKDDYFM